jgi:hypothetical protein
MIATMSIKPEDAILLSVIGRRLPGKPKYHTLLTWAQVGKKNRHSGQTVLLEMIRMPCGYCTSVEAYNQFLRDLNSVE